MKVLGLGLLHCFSLFLFPKSLFFSPETQSHQLNAPRGDCNELSKSRHCNKSTEILM